MDRRVFLAWAVVGGLVFGGGVWTGWTSARGPRLEIQFPNDDPTCLSLIEILDSSSAYEHELIE